MGYSRAGFEVVGVDTAPQDRYPFEFHQADALEFVREHGADFDLIHASPPCQRYSKAQIIRGRDHPDLIGPTRDAIRAIGLPYVLENVEGAREELRNPRVLCGAMFNMRTYRHRLFETVGFSWSVPQHPDHIAKTTKMGRPRKPGEFAQYVGNFSGVESAREDMQMPWSNRDGIREAIPPQYTEYIGNAIIRQGVTS